MLAPFVLFPMSEEGNFDVENSVSRLVDEEDDAEPKEKNPSTSSTPLSNLFPQMSISNSIWAPFAVSPSPSPSAAAVPAPTPTPPRVISVEELEKNIASSESKAEVEQQPLPPILNQLMQHHPPPPSIPPIFQMYRNPHLYQTLPPGYLPRPPFLPPPPMIPVLQPPPPPQQPYYHHHHHHQYRPRDVEFSEATDDDPYAGFMTQKDKDYLVKIQLLQLRTNNPYLDDFYNEMYTLKKREKENPEVAEEEEEKYIIPTVERETREYQLPFKEEGSLGKVSVSSVSTPRKIIDATSGRESPGLTTTHSFDARRRLLIEIERAYNEILAIDELTKKSNAMPDTTRNEYSEKILAHQETLKTTLNKDDVEFSQLLSIRKGRKLVGRVLNALGPGPNSQAFLLKLFFNLTEVLVRADSCLGAAVPAICRVVKRGSGDFIVKLFDSISIGGVFVSEFCSRVFVCAVQRALVLIDEESEKEKCVGAVSRFCERFSIPVAGGQSFSTATLTLMKTLIDFDGLSLSGRKNVQKFIDLVLKEV